MQQRRSSWSQTNKRAPKSESDPAPAMARIRHRIGVGLILWGERMLSQGREPVT